MGSTSMSHYKPPSNLYIVMDNKYCKVWIRKSDKFEHLQQYPIQIQNKQQYQQYQQMFILRIQQKYYPTCHYFTMQQSIYLCNSNKIGKILIERIPYRLCQFTNIAYRQGISILYYCINGYHTLYKRYGLFNVKSTMIGINQQYKIKLWYHTDYSSVQVEDKYCQMQYDMVNSIIRCIQYVLDYPDYGYRFSEYVQKRRIQLFNFEIALKMLEDYIQQYAIKILNKFNKIQKYLKQAEGILKFSQNRLSGKSLQKSQNSLLQTSKNRSLGKFSFKCNKIVDIDIEQDKDKDNYRQNNLYFRNNLYYNNNQTAKQSMYQQISSMGRNYKNLKISQKTAPTYHKNLQSKLNIISNKVNNSKNDSFVSLQQYGLYQKISKKHNHNRAASKFQKIARQPQAIRQFNHVRAASDFNKINKASIYYRNISPYMERSQENSSEDSRLKSIHNFIPLQSYSFTMEQFNRQQNSLKNFQRNK